MKQYKMTPALAAVITYEELEANLAATRAAFYEASAAEDEASAAEDEAWRRWNDLDKQADKNRKKMSAKQIAALKLDLSDAWAAYKRTHKERMAAYRVMEDAQEAINDKVLFDHAR